MSEAFSVTWGDDVAHLVTPKPLKLCPYCRQVGMNFHEGARDSFWYCQNCEHRVYEKDTEAFFPSHLAPEGTIWGRRDFPIKTGAVLIFQHGWPFGIRNEVSIENRRDEQVMRKSVATAKKMQAALSGAYIIRVKAKLK